MDFMRRLDGDILILGAGGKMGPSLARLCRRAAEAAGKPRRILAVSRTCRGGTRHRGHSLRPAGSRAGCAAARLSERAVPGGPEVRFLRESRTHLGDERLVPGDSGGEVCRAAAWWSSPPATCTRSGTVPSGRLRGVGRARRRSANTRSPASAASASSNITRRQRGLHCLFFRLNYAVDLRYGVLVDIARKVYAGEPVDLAVPAFNVIWQRDANSYALRALEHCSSPPRILNVTGAETLAGARHGGVVRGTFPPSLPLRRPGGHNRAVERFIGMPAA